MCWFPGIDYGNDRYKERYDLRRPDEDYINRDRVPRMPWHDIAVRLEGPVVVDIGRHFIQRWDFQKSHENKPVMNYSK